MKGIIYFLIIFNFNFCFSQFGIINDLDGFVNVRSSAKKGNNISDKLENGFIVYYFEPERNWINIDYAPTLFETSDPQFDKEKTIVNGKIFTLTRDKSGDGKIDVNDLEWTYLKGGGDFKSEEIKKLRDEAEIIITNPPFSLFREFLNWIIEVDKLFVLIGSMNATRLQRSFQLT